MNGFYCTSPARCALFTSFHTFLTLNPCMTPSLWINVDLQWTQRKTAAIKTRVAAEWGESLPSKPEMQRRADGQSLFRRITHMFSFSLLATAQPKSLQIKREINNKTVDQLGSRAIQRGSVELICQIQPSFIKHPLFFLLLSPGAYFFNQYNKQIQYENEVWCKTDAAMLLLMPGTESTVESQIRDMKWLWLGTQALPSRNPLVDDGNDTQRTFKSRAASHLDVRETFWNSKKVRLCHV